MEITAGNGDYHYLSQPRPNHVKPRFASETSQLPHSTIEINFAKVSNRSARICHNIDSEIRTDLVTLTLTLSVPKGKRNPSAVRVNELMY